MTHILAIGQSNLRGLFNAVKQMTESGTVPPPLSFSFIQMRRRKYNPYFPPESDGALNPNIVSELKTQVPRADAAVSCMGGNAHSVFGLLNHPEPYDFVADGLPLVQGRQVVPRSVVKASLKEQMEDGLKVFAALRSFIDKPMFHCQSPPPLPESHIRIYPGVFAERLDRFGVAPASFRLKLWKLQSEIYREFCAAHDIEFLPVPAECVDPDGLLTTQARGEDPTHGNAWYGERVVHQLAARLAAIPQVVSGA